MIMGVQGSRKFNDYDVFMRAMRTALSSMEDDGELYIYTAGPAKLNSMAIGFANITERTLKSQGIKIQVRRVPPTWFKEYMNDVDLFAYFCTPGEPNSNLVEVAEAANKIPYIYRYA